jgi:hypothetical protein
MRSLVNKIGGFGVIPHLRDQPQSGSLDNPGLVFGITPAEQKNLCH